MNDVKHLMELSSDWLLGHIRGVLIGFIIILAFQITNLLDLTVLFTQYERLSSAMNAVWWTDFGFTAIAALNWLLHKIC
jgi:hypothetical protein